MDIVFSTPEQRPGLPGDAASSDHMTSATRTVERSLLDAASAANADEIHDSIDTTAATKGIEGTGAWDAYDVWRRFIKEARDRRKGHPGSN